MTRLLLLAAAFACAHAYDHDVQAVKSVKGGHGGFNYQGGDISRFYNNNTNQNGFYSGSHTAGSKPAEMEVGVCYIEVPTANLVRDKVHVPAGNGSRPDMSRIRTCCKGYERNIHNFRICDPVCSPECVNGLCIAPDTCACYPDHVLTQAGLCVATCPIGCQNGHCDGGECMCKEGFKLDVGGKFCVPHCKNNCGGLGTCTGPNNCTCTAGYQPTPDGSCGISGGCGKCENGDCVSATECRCRSGYRKDSQGLCVPHCSLPCSINERCVAPEVCSLVSGTRHPAGPQQTNSQNPYGLGQNNTYYVPHQGSNYPLYPHNQNRPQGPNATQPAYPNQGGYPSSNTSHPQGTNYQPSPYRPQPGYPYPQPNQPQQGSGHPQTNPNQQQGSYYPYQPQQGSNYPPANPNQPHQGPNYPQTNSTHPQLGSEQPIYYHPYYPNYQDYPNQGSNYPHGQNTMNNQPNQENTPHFNQPNQGSFQPIGQSINVTYSQYPLHPENQLGVNRTNPYPYQPGQPNPNNQVPSSYNQGYNPQYPNQGSYNQTNFQTSHGYHSQEHSQSSFNQYGQSSFNQYGQRSFNQYDQSQQSGLCSQPCINGTCIDFNTCRCNPGYVTDEMDSTGNSCRPHCPGGCPNGYCVAPYTCACAEGYQRDTSVKGRPSCVRRIRRALHQLLFSIPDPADQ